MKKIIVLLFLLVSTGGILLGDTAEANTKIDKTDLGITFLKEQPVKPEPPIIEPKPPVTIEPIGVVPIKSHGRLPSTGDLISSLIWILLGISLLIIFVGIFSLKNIMSKMAWE